MNLKVKKLHENAKLPTRAVTADGLPLGCGYDLYAVESGFLDPLSRKRIPLGISWEFDPGHVALLLDRSSLANKGVFRMGGVIDPEYRGEVQVILFNTNGSPFSWEAGDRLCQVVFLPVALPVPVSFSELSETARGEKGFGSTGV